MTLASGQETVTVPNKLQITITITNNKSLGFCRSVQSGKYNPSPTITSVACFHSNPHLLGTEKYTPNSGGNPRKNRIGRHPRSWQFRAEIDV